MSNLRNSDKWNETSKFLPDENIVVLTKIQDWRGSRNEQLLKRSGRLWFFPDGSMYVYYTPTHWRENSQHLGGAVLRK